MTVPITGLVLIPLGLLITLMPWRYCLIALVMYALLSPAAVVNFGRFGLQPGYFLALLLIARTALDVAARRFVLNSYVLSRIAPLFVFLAIALFVLFIALTYFQGRVDTLPGTSGFKRNALQPFHLSRENFTQLAYLMLNLVLLYCLGHNAAREPLPRLLKTWDTALVTALLFSATICFWQFASQFGGPAFPSDFFYSNAGYARAENQTMAGMLRVSGPFEEPSTVGYVFTGFLLFAWHRYREFPTALSALAIAASLFSMLISTSTTAFFGIFLFCCIGASDIAAGRIYLVTRKRSSGQTAAIAIAILGAAVVAMAIAVKGPEIMLILKNTVLQKGESTSFQERSFADLQGLRILIETYGFGIGLGSHKANSLVVTILSNVGIAGFVAFCAFLYPLVFRGAAQARLSGAIVPFQWGIIGLLLIHAFSNPNLSTQLLWVHAGGVLGLDAALRHWTNGAPTSAPAIAADTPAGLAELPQHA